MGTKTGQLCRCCLFPCPFTKDQNGETVPFAKHNTDTVSIPPEPAPGVNDTVLDDPETTGRSDATKKITVWETIVNVTNSIQGVFIVNHPYAVLLGGFWAVVVMIVVGYIACYTGKILIRCMYEETERGDKVRVRNSWGEIGQEVFGQKFGGKIVNVAIVVEALSSCVVFLLLSSILLNACFPGIVSSAVWITIGGLLLLPSAYMKTLKGIYWLSLGKAAGHIAFCAIFIVYCLTEIPKWDFSAIQIGTSMEAFPICFGLIVFGYSGQPYYPTLEDNLEDDGRERFNYAMNISHIASALIKAVFSLVGVLTFNVLTQEAITDNIPIRGLKILMNLVLVAETLLTYPMIFFVAVGMIESPLLKQMARTSSSCGQDNEKPAQYLSITLRTMLALLIMGLAIGIPHFILLLSLIGNFTGTSLMFVFPCIFHLRLKWYILKWYEKTVDICIAGFGIIFGMVGGYFSIQALARAT